MRFVIPSFFLIIINTIIIDFSFSQDTIYKRKDFIYLSSNDTILKDYYWKLYNNSQLGKVVLLISKDNKNSLPKKFYLINQSRISYADIMMPVCCNELYLDKVLIVPLNTNVYLVDKVD